MGFPGLLLTQVWEGLNGHYFSAADYLVLYGTMRNVRGYLEGGLDEAGSGRVLWLRRGGLDALVGQRNQREEGGEFRLSDEHLSDFYV